MGREVSYHLHLLLSLGWTVVLALLQSEGKK